MCLNPISLPLLTGSSAAVIPCGKCAECLQKKSNELTVRTVREVQYYGDFYLVTLTYNQASVPIALTEFQTEVDFDGNVNHIPTYIEVLRKSKSSRFCRMCCSAYRQRFLDDCEKRWVTKEDTGDQVQQYQPLYFMDHDGKFKCLYWTVDSYDFQRIMKKARMRWFRKYDKPFPDFKYLAVPEYGGTTYRPHIHCLFLGLKREHIDFISKIWNDEMGTVDIRQVGYSMEDYTKVSHYVSAYANKGQYDCEFIKDGICKTPRKMISNCFGIGNPDDFRRLESWLKCEDIYGEYDQDDIENNPQKDEIVQDVMSRRYYEVNGYKYPLPQYIKQKIFFKYEDYEKGLDTETGEIEVGRHQVATALQHLVTNAIFEHLRRDFDFELQSSAEACKALGIVPYEVSDSIVDSQKNKAAAIEKNFITKIKHSKL